MNSILYCDSSKLVKSTWTECGRAKVAAVAGFSGLLLLEAAESLDSLPPFEWRRLWAGVVLKWAKIHYRVLLTSKFQFSRLLGMFASLPPLTIFSFIRMCNWLTSRTSTNHVELRSNIEVSSLARCLMVEHRRTEKNQGYLEINIYLI